MVITDNPNRTRATTPDSDPAKPWYATPGPLTP
jgi:hypothetical protein